MVIKHLRSRRTGPGSVALAENCAQLDYRSSDGCLGSGVHSVFPTLQEPQDSRKPCSRVPAPVETIVLKKGQVSS